MSDPTSEPPASGASGERSYVDDIFSVVRASLMELDGELRVLRVNRAFTTTPPGEPPEQPLDAITSGRWDSPEMRAALLGMLSGGPSELRDLRVEANLPPRGNRVLLVNALRLPDRGPGSPRLLLSVEDATERLEGVAFTREREDNLRQMLASAPEPIVIADAEGRVRFANTVAHKAFGYAPGELVGLRVDVLVPDERRVRHAEHVRTFMASPSARPTAEGKDLLGRRKDGTTFPVEIALAVMHSVDGPQAVAFLTDISSRREAEARAQAYNVRLQQLAFEIQVTEERERRRIAADLHDQIGQGLALLQIRMSNVRGRLPESLLRELDDCVSLVNQSIADVRSLTFDLSPPILYDLGLVPAIGWLAEQFAARSGVRVVVEGAESLSLDTDVAAVLFRVVRELLTNVVKHAHSPEARVTLTQEGGDVLVRVEDGGVGFEASQGERSRAGFGLFSVREQVQRLHGIVEITSGLGVGTRVSLRVPSARPASRGEGAA